MRIIPTIFALLFSVNAIAHNQVAVVPLVENAPPTNTVYAKSNGKNIGVYLERDYTSYQVGYVVLSLNEFLFIVDENTGLLEPETLYFSSNNCTGTPYTIIYRHPSMGIVFAAPPGAPASAYYIDANADTVQITVGSLLNYDFVNTSFQCSQYNDTNPKTLYPVMPNDPAVTGVQDSYPLPITIGF